MASSEIICIEAMLLDSVGCIHTYMHLYKYVTKIIKDSMNLRERQGDMEGVSETKEKGKLYNYVLI